MASQGIEYFESDANQRAAIFASDLGWMTCCWRGDRLERNSFGHGTRAAALRIVLPSSTTRWSSRGAFREADDLADRLRQYAVEFADAFLDVEIDLDGIAPFARRVLEKCRRIPLGETISYAELARRAGSPGAARAVGNTMARNRFPLIVPCHRVVGARGRLGGYSAPQGLTMKRRLLAAEARTREATHAS